LKTEDKQDFIEASVIGNNFANAVPVGLASFACSTIMFFALLTGRVDFSVLPVLGVFQFGILIVQLSCSWICFRNKDLGGASIYMLFSGTALFGGGMEFLGKLSAPSLEAWVYLTVAVVLLLWLPGYLKAPATIAIAILFLDLAFFCVAFMDFGAASLTPIGGYCFLIAAVFAAYSSGALFQMEEFGKVMLPMGKPWIK
jgi:succinate-acetate transporter protein